MKWEYQPNTLDDRHPHVFRLRKEFIPGQRNFGIDLNEERFHFNEVVDWCSDQFAGDYWRWYYKFEARWIRFAEENDAMAFRIRWC